MGLIGPPTSPKHADRHRLLPSRVFYIRGYKSKKLKKYIFLNIEKAREVTNIAAVAYSTCGRGIQGSQDSLCGPHADCHILRTSCWVIYYYLLYYSWLRDSIESYNVNCKQN